MKTVVKVYRDAQPEYDRWRDSLEEFARVVERELLDELTRRDGFPAGAEPVEGSVPQEWAWRFTGSVLIRYTLHTRFEPKWVPSPASVVARAWRWVWWRLRRRRTRLVLITAVEEVPPP